VQTLIMLAISLQTTLFRIEADYLEAAPRFQRPHTLRTIIIRVPTPIG